MCKYSSFTFVQILCVYCPIYQNHTAIKLKTLWSTHQKRPPSIDCINPRYVFNTCFEIDWKAPCKKEFSNIESTIPCYIYLTEHWMETYWIYECLTSRELFFRTNIASWIQYSLLRGGVNFPLILVFMTYKNANH